MRWCDNYCHLSRLVIDAVLLPKRPKPSVLKNDYLVILHLAHAVFTRLKGDGTQPEYVHFIYQLFHVYRYIQVFASSLLTFSAQITKGFGISFYPLPSMPRLRCISHIQAPI